MRQSRRGEQSFREVGLSRVKAAPGIKIFWRGLSKSVRTPGIYCGLSGM